jgi:hypothetical protein
MLRWTSRLRDTLIERNFRWAHRGGWTLREAEFMDHSTSGGFPESFDFLSLFHLFSYSGVSYHLTTPNVVVTYQPSQFSYVRDLEDPNAGNIGSEVPMQHPEILNVLWISLTEFISPCSLRLEGADVRNSAQLCEMAVCFHCPNLQWGSPKSMGDSSYQTIYTYSLNAFHEDAAAHLPSDTHFQFLRRLVRRLPVNYFCSVGLKQVNNAFTPRMYEGFLSAVASPSYRPFDSALSEKLVQVGLEGPINREQLEVVCAFRFHPCVRLCFQDFHQDVTPAVLHNVLATCRHVRHIVVPTCLMGFESPLFVSHIPVRSVQLFFGDEHSAWPQAVHDGIGSHCFLETLFVSLDPCHAKIAAGVLAQVLKGNPPSLRAVSIRFRAFGDDNDILPLFNLAASKRDWMPQSPAVPSLSFVSVFCASDQYRTRHRIAYMKNTRNWDMLITPAMMLNWFHQNVVPKQSASAANNCEMGKIDATGLMVRAANSRVVFRKTTRHTPYDLRPGSASVIFTILRLRTRQFVDTD